MKISEVERIRRYSTYITPEHIKDYSMDKPRKLFNFKSFFGEEINVYQVGGQHYTTFIATDSDDMVQMSVVGNFQKRIKKKSTFWIDELISAKNRKLRATDLYTQVR